MRKAEADRSSHGIQTLIVEDEPQWDPGPTLQCIDKLFLAILRKPRQGFAESMTRLQNSNLFDVCGI